MCILLIHVFYFCIFKTMRKHIYDFLGHLKTRKGERLPLWLWRLIVVATGIGFSECFLPVRLKTSIPGELPLQLCTGGKVGVLFISSFFLPVRNQLCECANQIHSYTIII